MLMMTYRSVAKTRDDLTMTNLQLGAICCSPDSRQYFRDPFLKPNSYWAGLACLQDRIIIIVVLGKPFYFYIVLNRNFLEGQ